MRTPSTLTERIKSYKRRYKRTLDEMVKIIHTEVEHLEDDIFEPCSAIESTAFRLIQEANRLKSLLEVEE